MHRAADRYIASPNTRNRTRTHNDNSGAHPTVPEVPLGDGRAATEHVLECNRSTARLRKASGKLELRERVRVAIFAYETASPAPHRGGACEFSPRTTKASARLR
jgi:hypothetical protein